MDPLSKPPEDIFSEALEDPLNNLSGGNTEPKKSAKDTKGAACVEVDLFSDPLGESGAQLVPDKNSAPLKSDISKSSAAQGDANSERFGAPQNDIKKSEDIFEEPPKEGTSKTAPRPLGGAAAGKKAPSADLFEDDDGDDLFEEPLLAVVKKPQAKDTSKGRTDQTNDATTDLFTEEVIRVPAAAAKPGTDTSSKTNGLHSDEDDLFTGTLSLLWVT